MLKSAWPFVDFSTGLKTSVTSIFSGSTSYFSSSFGSSSSPLLHVEKHCRHLCIDVLRAFQSFRDRILRMPCSHNGMRWPQRMVHHVRAVGPAVPYGDLMPVTTPPSSLWTQMHHRRYMHLLLRIPSDIIFGIKPSPDSHEY